VNYGYGFHSNDARGTTARVTAKGGLPADPVDALVRTKGGELGVRTEVDSRPAELAGDLDADARFGTAVRRRRR
jgi:hypothetical protein